MESLRHNFGGGPDETGRAREPAPFAGRYALELEASAEVHPLGRRAKDLSTGATVALRFFPSLLVLNPADMAFAQHVVSATQTLRHPGVVAAREIVKEGKDAAIVTPWVEGPTLRQVLSARATRFFRNDDLRRWLPALIDILEAAHGGGIVHGALNPDVVLLQDGGVRVVGFGVNAWLRRVQFYRGSSRRQEDERTYLSPAQRRLEKPGASDDVYALGAMIYEMLAGTPPASRWWSRWPRGMARQRSKNRGSGESIPSAWERAVRQCLEPRDRDRLASVRELRSRLQLAPPASVASRPTPAPVAASARGPTPAPKPVPAAPPTKTLVPPPPATPAALEHATAPPPDAALLPPETAPPVPVADARSEHVQAEVPVPAREPAPAPDGVRTAPPPPAAVSGAPPSAPAPVEIPPPEETASPTRPADAAREGVRTGAPEPADATAPQPKRKVDTSAWPPPRLRPPTAPPPARVGGAPAARTAPTTPAIVSPPRNVASGNGSRPPGTFLLRCAYVLVLIATAVVGGWMVWRHYEDRLGTPAPRADIRTVPPVVAEKPRVAEEDDAAAERPEPASIPRADLLAGGEEVAMQPREMEPAAVAPETGAIEVRSEPPNAEVRVEGRTPQRSPFRTESLAPGSHQVEVRLAGYAPFAATVAVVAGGVAQVDARLERLTGGLRVVSDPIGVAFVVRNSEGPRLVQEGVTPAELRLPTGRYFVDFRRDGAIRVCIADVGTDDLAVARVTYPTDPDRAAVIVQPPREEAKEAEPTNANLPPLAGADEAPATATVPDDVPVAPVEPPAAPLSVAAIDSGPAGTGRAVRPDSLEAGIPVAAPADAEAVVKPGPAATATDRPGEPVLAAADGPPLEGGILELGGVDVPPRLMERADPVVPRRHLEVTERARVDLILVIDRMGRVASAEVRLATDPTLVEPCLEAVRLWRFSPATKQGRPVPVRVSVPILFGAP